MLKPQHVKSVITNCQHILVNISLSIGLLTAANCIAIAAPNLDKSKLQSVQSNISFSADQIESENHRQTRLTGKVNVLINNKINILADKMLILYENDKPYKVAKLIIYGKGTLIGGGNQIKFINGLFNPNTLQLSAEKLS